MKQLFRPCIDLHDGKVKQIVGSTLNSSLPETALATNFVSTRPPAYYAGLYREHELRGGHIIKLGPGNEAAAEEALRAWPGGLQIGGGINAENAGHYLELGADKVIVTSAVFRNGIFDETALDKLVQITGKDRLVLDLSCRKNEHGDYAVVTERWKNFTGFVINRENLEFLGGRCAEFLIHAVDVEGKRTGIDEELLTRLAADAPIEVVYAGGISSVEDMTKIIHAGQGRIAYTIGSALDIFGGNMSFEKVIELSKI